MKLIRVALHSLVLVMADIAGIGLGALAAFQVLGVSNQVWLQVPVAVVLTTCCFCAWVLCLRVLRWRRLLLFGSKELGACMAGSLLWAPLVFVPLHYLTQGYLTSLGNLVALAIYQVPVNLVALFCCALLSGANSASEESPKPSPSPTGNPTTSGCDSAA